MPVSARSGGGVVQDLARLESSARQDEDTRGVLFDTCAAAARAWKKYWAAPHDVAGFRPPWGGLA